MQTSPALNFYCKNAFYFLITALAIIDCQQASMTDQQQMFWSFFNNHSPSTSVLSSFWFNVLRLNLSIYLSMLSISSPVAAVWQQYGNWIFLFFFTWLWPWGQSKLFNNIVWLAKGFRLPTQSRGHDRNELFWEFFCQFHMKYSHKASCCHHYSSLFFIMVCKVVSLPNIPFLITAKRFNLGLNMVWQTWCSHKNMLHVVHNQNMQEMLADFWYCWKPIDSLTNHLLEGHLVLML